MALTADELVVIGRGKLIAQCTTAEFVATTTETTIRVRSPQLAALTAELRARGGKVREDGTDAILVSGLDTDTIGELAAGHGIPVYELSEHHGSLEDAFLRLTGDATEYHLQVTR
jgi:ABC-2 type transport system ATP-binding protein